MSPTAMEDLGPEPADVAALRAWFTAQESQSLERLEAGAQTLTQLVTGLYGVLFAVLAFSDMPAYLSTLGVRLCGTISVVSFFGALVAALYTQLPRRYAQAEKYNVSQLQALKARMLRRKLWGVRIAGGCFGLGTLALAGVILWIVWS